MLSFKNFIEAEMTTGEQVPPGVDPAMWANPSYQKFWKAQNQQQAPQQAGQQQPNAAQQQKPYQQQQQKMGQFQDMNAIQTAIQTQMSRIPGMPNNGTLRNLTDLSLVSTINNKIKTGEIPLQPSSIRAMEAGRGVQFYKDKTGNIAFVINR